MPTIKGTENYGIFIADYTQSGGAGVAPSTFVFINPTGSGEYYQIIEAAAHWDVIGGASAAADVQVVPTGSAVNAGTSALAATFNLTTGARTPTKAALSNTAGNRIVPPGSAVSVVTSGTLTGLAGLVVQVVIKPLRNSKKRFA